MKSFDITNKLGKFWIKVKIKMQIVNSKNKKSLIVSSTLRFKTLNSNEVRLVNFECLPNIDFFPNIGPNIIDLNNFPQYTLKSFKLPICFATKILKDRNSIIQL